MGDLAADTSVAGADGRYVAALSRDWAIWGPNGGYVAALALRAAGLHSGLPRPASLVGHFLGVGRFDDPVEIHCRTLRTARSAQSVGVTLSQAGAPVFEALVWAVTAPLAGLEHQAAPMPQVPHWSGLPTSQERLAARGETDAGWYPFWRNFEQRPPQWRDDWEERKSGDHEPLWQQWLRYRPTASFDDSWVDACRLLILVDVGSWPSASAHHNQQEVIAPSIDLACAFHRIRPGAEWLLVEGRSPAATEGLVASHQCVWDEHGTLLASGTSQLLCRPVAKGAPRG